MAWKALLKDLQDNPEKSADSLTAVVQIFHDDGRTYEKSVIVWVKELAVVDFETIKKYILKDVEDLELVESVKAILKPYVGQGL